jgi:septum site-determining protein MinC
LDRSEIQDVRNAPQQNPETDETRLAQSHKPLVQIKGIREGLMVNLGEGEWQDLEAALLKQLDRQKEFLQGARLALDVGNHILRAAELGRLRDQISERGLTLWCVLGDSPKTQETAQTLGLATRIHKLLPGHSLAAADTNVQGDQAMLVKRTLRSGFSLKFPGHVVIVGDVNPGAEVIAGGDVVVWGRLRGMVHAGAEGDESAVVYALDLSPTQLRIAGQIAVTPKKRGKSLPEVARLQNGQVTAGNWDAKENG